MTRTLPEETPQGQCSGGPRVSKRKEVYVNAASVSGEAWGMGGVEEEMIYHRISQASLLHSGTQQH